MTFVDKNLAELLIDREKDLKEKKKITFKDVEIMNSPDTKQIVLPEGMSPEEGRRWLENWEEQQSMRINVNYDIDVWLFEGLIAVREVLRNLFGWVNAVPSKSFWGPQPPKFLTVPIGPDETTTVLWGDMMIPGIDGLITTAYHYKDGRLSFTLTADIPKKQEPLLAGIADAIKKYVRENSIYRGKAIQLSQGDITNGPIFIDTHSININELIFPMETQEILETTLFTPIRHTQICREAGTPLKRGFLLEGPYGVGKTLTANATAKLAEENGWTYIYLTSVEQLKEAINIAQMYQPAIIFSEDVDSFISSRSENVNEILNTLDGVNTKSMEVMVILTTNHVDRIDEAMRRPGRIDTIIPIRAPDADAAARLIRHYAREMLVISTTNEELQEAISPVLGANAAVIREVVERAKLAAVRRTSSSDFFIGADDIRIAANSMKPHVELMAKPKEQNEVDLFQRVGEKISNAVLSHQSKEFEKMRDNILEKMRK